MLNGALFNRIGSRIADQPYLQHVFYAILGLTITDSINLSTEIKYSKRILPNNLPPDTNNNTSNLMNGVFHIYNSSFLLYRLKLYAIGISGVFAIKLNEKLSKPFKNDLLRPPW